MLVDKLWNNIYIFEGGKVLIKAPMADNDSAGKLDPGHWLTNRCVVRNGNLPYFIGMGKSMSDFSGLAFHSIPRNRSGAKSYSPNPLGNDGPDGGGKKGRGAGMCNVGPR